MTETWYIVNVNTEFFKFVILVIGIYLLFGIWDLSFWFYPISEFNMISWY
jgi:hypothetical protein